MAFSRLAYPVAAPNGYPLRDGQRPRRSLKTVEATVNGPNVWARGPVSVTEAPIFDGIFERAIGMTATEQIPLCLSDVFCRTPTEESLINWPSGVFVPTPV